MKVTDWSEKLNQWREYAEALYPLRGEISDIFETKHLWDEHWQYHEQPYEADDDTVFLLKLSEKLNGIYEFIKGHIEVLEHRVSIEEDIRFNVEQAFEAWRRGLCPVLMRGVQRYVKPPHYDAWGTYDEIAEFLDGELMSYEATQRAIHEWQLSREKLKLSA